MLFSGGGSCLFPRLGSSRAEAGLEWSPESLGYFVIQGDCRGQGQVKLFDALCFRGCRLDWANCGVFCRLVSFFVGRTFVCFESLMSVSPYLTSYYCRFILYGHAMITISCTYICTYSIPGPLVVGAFSSCLASYSTKTYLLVFFEVF